MSGYVSDTQPNKYKPELLRLHGNTFAIGWLDQCDFRCQVHREDIRFVIHLIGFIVTHCF